MIAAITHPSCAAKAFRAFHRLAKRSRNWKLIDRPERMMSMLEQWHYTDSLPRDRNFAILTFSPIIISRADRVLGIRDWSPNESVEYAMVMCGAPYIHPGYIADVESAYVCIARSQFDECGHLLRSLQGRAGNTAWVQEIQTMLDFKRRKNEPLPQIRKEART